MKWIPNQAYKISVRRYTYVDPLAIPALDLDCTYAF